VEDYICDYEAVFRAERVCETNSYLIRKIPSKNEKIGKEARHD
jgi:hypothetical protein